VLKILFIQEKLPLFVVLSRSYLFIVAVLSRV